MPEISINVDVWCASCGAALCHCTEARQDQHGMPGLEVTACEICLDKALAEGYDAGHNAGMALAEEDAAAE